MSRLHAVVALSRLVNPTSAGDRYCVLVYHYGMKNSGIFSIRFRGISPDITLVTDPRDQLSVEDGKVLRTLMPWISGKMHPRVHRAYWNHEYAMRSYYLDARWTSVVSGLEALMNVGDKEVSWQFRDRVRQLAEEFHIGLSDDDLRTSYRRARSWFMLRDSYSIWKPYCQRPNTLICTEGWNCFCEAPSSDVCWTRASAIFSATTLQ